MGPGRKDDAATRLRIRKYGFAEENVRNLFAAGVPIAVGTDAGIGGAKHGYSTLQEMELLVAAGLTPKAALLAGSSNSALALGLAHLLHCGNEKTHQHRNDGNHHQKFNQRKSRFLFHSFDIQ